MSNDYARQLARQLVIENAFADLYLHAPTRETTADGEDVLTEFAEEQIDGIAKIISRRESEAISELTGALDEVHDAFILAMAACPNQDWAAAQMKAKSQILQQSYAAFAKHTLVTAKTQEE